METRRICQSCQKPLPQDTPLGLCPECLLKAGFHSAAETKSESEPPGRAPFTPPTVEELAVLFPQLEILALLGKGGMGAVYKARQKQLNRLVALKILPPGIGADPARAERFTREAQALAQLNHPGIVTLYEFGRTADMHFFLMEFVDGVNLGQALARGRIEPREALSIVPQICDALQFAHDQGIVHRDIKPENILLDRRGHVKVADFGVAMLLGGGSEGQPGGAATAGSVALTEAGNVLGTPRYMSPEQLDAPSHVDRRADIYALGVVFYQMLTGELPGKTIEPPSKKVQLDVRLDEVVLHALEKKPERRYQQASELKTSVERIAGMATPQNGTGPSEQVPLPARPLSRPLLTGLAVVAAIVAALLLLSPGLMKLRPEPKEEGTRDAIVRSLRSEVGRQLREAGGLYDDLQVTVEANRDSATPFKVSYRGLRNFRGSDGTVPAANGSFLMGYGGGGLWEGTLAGTRFAVQVGSRDNIDLPFVDDPQVIGTWSSVDFVPEIARFVPGKRAWHEELYLKELTFRTGGKTAHPWFTWTRGFLLHSGDKTASRYEIREMSGVRYLFLEWKSGDFAVLGKKPHYYVLQPKTNQPETKGVLK